MFTVEILPIVYNDLLEIESYISRDRPDSAQKVVKNITTAIKSLVNSPYLASSLRKKFGLDTDLHGRIVKPYIIIYSVNESNIKVYRVLDCRSDYLSALGFTTKKEDAN